MRIDTNTVNILKNFASINPSIVIQEGNTLKTISPSKTIMAKATVNTDFNRRFALYKLDEFLATHSIYSDPEVVFLDSWLEFKEGKENSKIWYADENLVTKAPDKELKLPSIDASFTIKNDDLRKVERAAGVHSLPEIHVAGINGTVFLKASNSKNPTTNEFSKEIGTTDKNFCAIFKIENLKIIPGDYEVSVSSKGISHFSGKDAEYWIAIEQNSTF